MFCTNIAATLHHISVDVFLFLAFPLWWRCWRPTGNFSSKSCDSLRRKICIIKKKTRFDRQCSCSSPHLLEDSSSVSYGPSSPQGPNSSSSCCCHSAPGGPRCVAFHHIWGQPTSSWSDAPVGEIKPPLKYTAVMTDMLSIEDPAFTDASNYYEISLLLEYWLSVILLIYQSFIEDSQQKKTKYL